MKKLLLFQGFVVVVNLCCYNKYVTGFPKKIIFSILMMTVWVTLP